MQTKLIEKERGFTGFTGKMPRARRTYTRPPRFVLCCRKDLSRHGCGESTDKQSAQSEKMSPKLCCSGISGKLRPIAMKITLAISVAMTSRDDQFLYHVLQRGNDVDSYTWTGPNLISFISWSNEFPGEGPPAAATGAAVRTGGDKAASARCCPYLISFMRCANELPPAGEGPPAPAASGRAAVGTGDGTASSGDPNLKS